MVVIDEEAGPVGMTHYEAGKSAYSMTSFIDSYRHVAFPHDDSIHEIRDPSIHDSASSMHDTAPPNYNTAPSTIRDSTTTLVASQPGRKSFESTRSKSCKSPACSNFSFGDYDFETYESYLGRRGKLIPIPELVDYWGLNGLRYIFFSTYKRLFTVVFLGNIAGLIYVLCHHRTVEALSDVTAVNLAVNGLVRLPHITNQLYRIFCSLPRSWPIFLRRTAAKISHFGGVHSGTGIAALFWYISFCGVLTHEYITQHTVSKALLGIAYSILSLLVAIVLAAFPLLRFMKHDAFEFTHRLGAWAVLALFWVLTNLYAKDTRTLYNQTVLHRLLHLPTFYSALLLTLALLTPWLTLKRVAVRPEVLSPHAVRLHFGYTTTGFSQGISMSRSPWRDWHSFAAIPDPDKCVQFSCLVSKAGDWTSGVIKSPPSHLWVRGIPGIGFGYACVMFRKVLLVATGSGIGPCMSILACKTHPPLRIIWSTRSPRKTYGEGVMKLVAAADPNAIVLDTDEGGGRKDINALAWDVVKDFGAEAVFVVSKPSVTQKMVYMFESRGVPAYGPVFDS